MFLTSKKAVGSTGRLFFLILSLWLSAAAPASAQRLFHVDAETKVLHNGTSRVVEKQLYYTRGGNLNILWKIGAVSYYSATTAFGFTDFYYPAANQAMSMDSNMFKASDELLYLFAEGGMEDMGLSREGFVLKTSKKDGDYTVRRYEPKKRGGLCAWVEVAYDQQFRPVYCAYFNKKGRIITKTYLSHYQEEKGFAFPMRVTEISYNLAEKNDSTIRLDVYKNLELDIQREAHLFRVPSNAEKVDLKEGLKSVL